MTRQKTPKQVAKRTAFVNFIVNFKFSENKRMKLILKIDYKWCEKFLMYQKLPLEITMKEQIGFGCVAV